ncbi:inositol phosphosphingolipid phospholipase C [Hortaea werneckii]|nr:inositol phosphosphingolipid phospholipase C [Hortaea werneckii]KAI7076976.1 inositol phosphosphingolipid phospholipase C [Hortaea werneckii]KAI7204428.1 inositol phosphosphingolipid phospholipase C [Hortaea werneckii]
MQVPDKDAKENISPQPKKLLELPTSLRVISLNCWGLKFISKHRHERLVEIGRQLANASPEPSIVGLQECWTQQDYLAIRELTKDILPYGKFYWSGIFGGGLAILSKWPIEESSMYRYPLNGRPAAFFRGDWYVGKGVACARIRIGPRPKDVVEVFCTHLHAPYEREPNDSYICHRTAQAWEIAKLMRHAAERGHMVLGLGDFNMIPLSLAHRLIEAHSPVRDIWRIVKPDSAIGSANNPVEQARGKPVPSARQCLVQNGTTCDSQFNTWRWSKQMLRDLERGKDSVIDPETPDLRAKRLDYVFFASQANHVWTVGEAEVGMTMRHPKLRCSLSDHFSIETTLLRQKDGDDDNATNQTATTTTKQPPADPHQQQQQETPSFLPLKTYDEILTMITKYDARERRQRRQRLTHFGVELCLSIGCLIAVWWSPRNFVSFLLMLLSTLGLSAGVLDGLMGGLFVGSELRALREFEFEMRNTRVLAAAAAAAAGDDGEGGEGGGGSEVEGDVRKKGKD